MKYKDPEFLLCFSNKNEKEVFRRYFDTEEAREQFIEQNKSTIVVIFKS